MRGAVCRRPIAGFTLLEVLVALVVVALGMSALLEVLTQSAANVAALRDKTVAEWIAMNQIALVRLNLTAPAVGVTQGDVIDCANGDWHWEQQVAAVDAVPGLLSITVSVRRTGRSQNPSRDGTGEARSNAPRTPGSLGLSGASGTLGAHSSLGATAPLGSIRSLASGGCASAPSAGGSLADASLGASGLSGSLGAPDSLGGPSLSGPAAPGSGATGRTSAGATGTAAGGGAQQLVHVRIDTRQHWLVTLTGFRGDSLAAASGESPDWAGSTYGNAGSGNGRGAPGAPAGPGLGASVP